MAFQPTRVPNKISPELINICEKKIGHSNISFVDIRGTEDYRAKKCALNALEEAKKVDGEIVFGWAVYIWDGVLYDFVGHAVVKLNDKLYCVTPSQYPEDKLLFIADSSISFDFDDSNSRMPSTEISISKHKEISQLITVRETIRNIKLNYQVTSEQVALNYEDSEAMRTLEKQQRELMDKAIYYHHPVKNKCSCGSGKQFRKCCRPYMQKAFA
jgi:hypothetical protein